MYQYLKFIGTHIKLFSSNGKKKGKDAQQVEQNLYIGYYKLCSIIFWEHIIQKYVKMASFCEVLFMYRCIEIYSINYSLMLVSRAMPYIIIFFT